MVRCSLSLIGLVQYITTLSTLKQVFFGPNTDLTLCLHCLLHDASEKNYCNRTLHEKSTKKLFGKCKYGKNPRKICSDSSSCVASHHQVRIVWAAFFSWGCSGERALLSGPKERKKGGTTTTKEQLQAQDPLLSSGKTDEKRGRFE